MGAGTSHGRQAVHDGFDRASMGRLEQRFRRFPLHARHDLQIASPDVEVYDNTVERNADGIGAAQQARGSGAYGPHELSNLWVHDNRIVMTQGLTGIVDDVGDQSYYTSRNNRFDRKRYQLGPGNLFFAWMNRERSDRNGDDSVRT